MELSVLYIISVFGGLFIVAFLVSSAMTEVSRRLALRFKIYDKPGARKMHLEPVPYLGGLGLYLSFLIFNLIVLIFLREGLPAWFWPAAIAGLLLLLTGLYDDIKGLSAWVKFSVQIASVLILYFWAGIKISGVAHPFEGVITFGPISALVTVLWALLIINAINLIDGLDGLAGGVVMISSLFLFVIMIIQGNAVAGIFPLGVAGICLGFLRYNFSPARIFMGDAGSMFLGFLLAVQSMTLTSKAPTIMVLLFPILVLGIPIFDTALAFLRRLSQGKHPFKGDTRHVHHRFLAIGLNPRQSVLIIYFFSIILGLFALVMMKLTPAYRGLSLGLLAMMASFVIIAMQYLEDKFMGSIAELRAYRKWLKYNHRGNGQGPTAVNGATIENGITDEESSSLAMHYQPPSLMASFTEKLLRAEEQRTERIIALTSPETTGRLQKIAANVGHRLFRVEKPDQVLAIGKSKDVGVVILEQGPDLEILSELIIQLRVENPTITILILADEPDRPALLELIKLGVYDLLPRNAPDEILESILQRDIENRYLSRRLRFMQILFWVLILSIPIWLFIGRFIAVSAGR